MQSPQNTGPEQPGQGYGQQPAYEQQPRYEQQPAYGQPGYQNSPLPSAMGGYEAPRVGGQRVLKKINAGSAFKVGAITYALLWAIFGLPYVFILGSVMTAVAQRTGQGAAVGGFGIGMYLFGIIGSALAGGIGAAISAFAYNLVAGWVGGLEIEVS